MAQVSWYKCGVYWPACHLVWHLYLSNGTIDFENLYAERSKSFLYQVVSMNEQNSKANIRAASSSHSTVYVFFSNSVNDFPRIIIICFELQVTEQILFECRRRVYVSSGVIKEKQGLSTNRKAGLIFPHCFSPMYMVYELNCSMLRRIMPSIFKVLFSSYIDMTRSSFKKISICFINRRYVLYECPFISGRSSIWYSVFPKTLFLEICSSMNTNIPP